MTTPAGRIRGTSMILGAILLIAVGAIGLLRLRDRGPRPFDPDRHLRTVARLPGTGTGLPDLESMAPDPRPVNTIDFGGTEMLVVTFDGLIRNLGPGPLDIFGNPNTTDDNDRPRQRIWNGDDWVPANRPPIRFESADGHNHFHYLQIARYSLWDSTASVEIAPSNKVGFCLIDSVQDNPAAARGYFSDDGNYCRQGSPEATVLRMGISPGFSDLYDSAVALQWVDVSDVAPGKYRVAAEVDPFDQVEEADETNNTIAFADTVTVVPGHVAQPTIVNTSGFAKFVLTSDTFGPTGGLAYRITSPPRHGTVELPAPDSPLPIIAVYVSDPGFSGVDTFRFVAYDPASPWPLTPVESVVLVSVGDDPEPTIAIDGRRAVLHTSSVLDLAVVGTESVPPGKVTWSVDGIDGGSARSGTIDSTGTYRGPSEAVGAVVISAAVGSLTTSIEIEVITPPNQRPFIQAPIEYLPLADAADTQEKATVDTIPRGRRTGFIVPATDPNGDQLSFGATGLPPGLAIDERTGFVSGKPTQRGTFVVTFTADDGTTTSSIEVTLTID